MNLVPIWKDNANMGWNNDADMSRVLFRINNARMSEVLFQFWNNKANTSHILVRFIGYINRSIALKKVSSVLELEQR